MNASKLLDWRGYTAVILASGPSLTAEQVLTVENAEVKTIAVNSTVYKMAIPDVAYAGDLLWLKANHNKIDVGRATKTARWTCDRSAAERYGLNWIKGVNREGLSRESKWINTNGNSGFQAINLAYLFGVRRILLLGFDMCLGVNGERHHHPDHPAPMVQAQTFGDWLYKANFLARDLKDAGCEVINCSGRTALTCWPRSTIEKELL